MRVEGAGDAYHVQIVVWTLLINMVVIWTPLVVFLTKRLSKLEGLLDFASRIEKIDLPARLTAQEVKTDTIARQISDHPARVTALEVLTTRMQADLTDSIERQTDLEREHLRMTGRCKGGE